MTRPRTLRGLLWQLAIAYPKHALGAMLVGVCLLGLAAAGRSRHVSQCRFEQMWYAGDQHFNERLEFRVDSTGTWIQGGCDSDAKHRHKDFRWARTASTLTVRYDRDQQRTVQYRIERRGDACYLTFQDHPFLSDGSGFRHFADWSGF